MAGVDRDAPPVLRLLAQPWTAAIVRELAVSPGRPVELERRLPDIPHSVLMDRLKQLVDRGAATRERRYTGDGHPVPVVQTSYALTPAGEELLPIIADALEWERRGTGG